MTSNKDRIKSMWLPAWAAELVTLYEAGSTSQFLCYGNVHDRLLMPLKEGVRLGTLSAFLTDVMMPRFDVVLSYDLGNGLTVERGGETFAKWPRMRDTGPRLPREPAAAVDLLSHYIRFVGNLRKLGQPAPQVGVMVRGAELIVPAGGGGGHDLAAIASQMRDWADDDGMLDHAVATFLIADNLADLHPLVASNPRAHRIKIPLPEAGDVAATLALLAPRFPVALKRFAPDLQRPAAMLAGATVSSLESLLKAREHLGEELDDAHLVAAKKAMVEQECQGLIDFVAPKRTLDDLHGQEAVKAWIRQDIALWQAGDLQAVPMGYLLCGPVGTGKTFMVECLAGEAGVPVVKLKNFRDKWVGSTEGNLEKIFRLIQALGRAIVFVDEADVALGRRDGGANDAGVGGRVYGMMAEEMSNTRNRGRVLWVLASSRPDLIEVDLKRPGRIDVKIPLFPTVDARESFGLVRALMRRRGLELADGDFEGLKDRLPTLLTPGAAEALAVKVYRTVKVGGKAPLAALGDCLVGYQNPVPLATIERQIDLAVAESTDIAFVPTVFRERQP
ncbi:MAG TPA: ATP-binding protein [Planctomycetota bacterium]|nr:ATP-binding protein [Planctomycetota bacterium]